VNRIYNLAHVPDFMPRTLAILSLDDATVERLLSLRNVFEMTKKFQHVEELYALEIHDCTIEIAFETNLGDDLELAENAYEDWVDAPLGLEGEEQEQDDDIDESQRSLFDSPRPECMTMLVLSDGVKWEWYEKHDDDLCSTSILPWAVLEDERKAERCEKCGTPYSQASIDGGRCLGSDPHGRFCGTSIAAVRPEVQE